MKHFLLLIFIFLFCSSFTLAQEYTPDANTVALYHFNETSGSTVSDASSNGNNGTATGTTIVDGKFGKSRSFDSLGAYIDVGSDPSLKIGGNQITVEAWIFIRGDGFNWPRIVLGGSVDRAYTLCKNSDTDDRILWRPVISGHPYVYGDVVSITPLSRNQWHHVAGVYNGATTRIYVDGVLSNSVDASGNLATDPKSVVIGGETVEHEGAGTPSWFDGMIDEVRISNKAREPWEFNYPIVKSVDPSQNALNVSKSTNISVTFNVPMNPSTLTTNNILVYGSQYGKHTGAITLSGDTSFTFDPTTDFRPGEVVTVTLTKNIMTATGDSLTNGYHWSFTIHYSISTGTFADTVNYATGSFPIQVFIYDIDNDADGDIVLANQNSDSISVLKNNGDGTFAPKVDYPTGSYPGGVFVSDIDGDNYGDVLVTNSHSANISVFKNNGDGTFATRVDYPTGNYPHTIYAYDIDGDGDFDIVVANTNSGTITVLKNKGDGTFDPKVDYPTVDNPPGSDNPHGLFISDIDGDGDGDVVVASHTIDKISVLKNNGDGTFAPKVDYQTGIRPEYVFISDIDGDNDNDVIVANFNSDKISALKNNGDGTFAPKVDYTVGHKPYSVFVSDVDGDGDGDIVSANYDPKTISVLRNNGDGTFALKVDYPTGIGTHKIFISDIDGDGDGDVVVTNAGENTVSILKNRNPHTPVIIIPGIMGSPLYDDVNDDNHFTINERIWIDFPKLIDIDNIYPNNCFLDVLQLNLDGENPLNPNYHIKVSPRKNGDITIDDELGFGYPPPIASIYRLPLSKYGGLIKYLKDSCGYTLDKFDNNHNEGEDLYCLE